MRKSELILFLILFLAALAPAQTTTFNGVIKDLSNTPIPTGQVTFALKPSVDTTISGQGRFVPSTTFCEIHNPAITSTSGTGTITVNVGTAQTWQVGDSLIFVGTADATLNGSSVATPYTITLVNSTTSFNFTQSGTHTNGAGGTVGGLYKSGGTGACSVMQSSAITPANTYYSVSLWPIFSLTSSFNTYAIGSGPVDISTVVPTPGQQPAYSFVDLFTNQTITGIKTFSNGIIFNGGISSAGPNNLAGGGTLGGTFNCTIVNAVRCISPSNPQGWAGSDLGAWLNAAQAGCAASCTVQVASGTYTLSTAASIGNIAGTNSVSIQLGAVAIAASATITVYRNSQIIGLPASSGTGTPAAFPLSAITQASGANLAAIIQCGDGTNNGNNCVLQDIGVDGNQINNTTALDAILINKSSRYKIDGVTVRNARRDNVRVFSTVTAGIGNNESNTGKIYKLSSQNAWVHGLNVIATSDTGVTSYSEFENNGQSGTGYGINCLTCGGLRVEGPNDFGGNASGGILLAPNLGQLGGATGMLITGNQFGFNLGPALTIQGWDSTTGTYGIWGVNVQGNNIFSSNVAMTTNAFDAINITDSRLNSVKGNVIQNLAAGHVFRYGINLVETSAGRLAQNEVIGNPMDTLFGTGTFTDNGSNFNTSYYGNPELSGVAAWRLSTPYLRNADTIKWKDASGSLFSVFQVDAANKIFFYGHATAKDMLFQPNAGTTRFELTDALATFSVPLASPTLNTPTLSGITNATGLQLFNATTTCTTGASVGAICTTGAITLPVAYADTNYRLSCTGQGATNVPIVQTYAKSNTTFTITIAALTAAAATFTSYDCSAVHN